MELIGGFGIFLAPILILIVALGVIEKVWSNWAPVSEEAMHEEERQQVLDECVTYEACPWLGEQP